MPARPTIADIARSAGVSKSAVSFALNGRPGVSAATRARVLATAADIGWVPNAAARSLAATTSGAIGLVLARPARTLGIEPFFMQLIAGIEGELAAASQALVFQVVEDHAAEVTTYRRWFAERRVDGVILVDPHVDDDRVEPLTALGLRCVFVGIPRSATGLFGVWSDDDASMTAVLRYLARLGHSRVARVAGSAQHDHVAVRTEAFARSARLLRLSPSVVGTDYSPEQGARATRQLLAAATPPTAIVYDNDVMALAGLAVTQEMGVSVPAEVSLVAWDDSTLCRVSYPKLTAVSRDIGAFGATAARLLLEQVQGEPPRSVETAAGELAIRGSTAPPPND